MRLLSVVCERLKERGCGLEVHVIGGVRLFVDVLPNGDFGMELHAQTEGKILPLHRFDHLHAVGNVFRRHGERGVIDGQNALVVPRRNLCQRFGVRYFIKQRRLVRYLDVMGGKGLLFVIAWLNTRSLYLAKRSLIVVKSLRVARVDAAKVKAPRWRTRGITRVAAGSF